MNPVSELPFRKNVAVVVVNNEGLLLACRRADIYRSWQLPQGGIDEGETPAEAMYRELQEEVGLNSQDVELLGSLPTPIRYQWPEHLYSRGYQGQEQYYFLVRARRGAVIMLNTSTPPEFNRTAWIGVSEFLRRVSGTFKEQAYREGVSQLNKRFPGTLSA